MANDQRIPSRKESKESDRSEKPVIRLRFAIEVVFDLPCAGLCTGKSFLVPALTLSRLTLRKEQAELIRNMVTCTPDRRGAFCLFRKRDIALLQRLVDRPSPSERIALVQKFSLFLDVSPADCATIISASHEKNWSRRQTLFSIGDSVDEVFLLLSGSVKITQVGFKGTEVILRLSGMGDLIGILSLGPQGTHNSSAEALQPSIALVWDSTTFAKLLERFASLRNSTFRVLEQRLHELEQRLREFSTEDVSSRLSSELIRLSTRFGYGVNGDGEIRLSHTDLAQLTGTTLSTVSRLLSRWQKLGIISIGRAGMHIRDFSALEQFSQND